MSQVTTTLHKDWLENPNYKEAFDATKAEFEETRQLLEAQMKSESLQTKADTPTSSSE